MSIKDAIKKKANGEFDEVILFKKLNNLFLHDNEHDDEERRGLHASSIVAPKSSFCYREQVLSCFFKMNNEKTQLPVGLLRIFRAGNDIHKKWQDMLNDSGLATGIELRRYSKEYDFYLTPDAEAFLVGKSRVVEIKSQNTYAYQKQKDHKGRVQLNLYMHFLGYAHGIILVEDKNNQEFKVLTHEYDPLMAKKYIKRLQKVKKYRSYYKKTGKIPKGICKSRTCKRAQRCSMSQACFNFGQGRVKLDE